MTQRLCSKLAHKWPPKFPNLCSYFAYIVALKMMPRSMQRSCTHLHHFLAPKIAEVLYPF